MCETGGQEHFTDNNSNGIFDSGDTFSVSENDITEPFLDRNEDGTRNPAEYFDDVNQNGVWNTGNGTWDANTKIWAESLIVFRGAPVNIELADATSPSGIICVSDVNGNAIMGGSTVEIAVPPPNTVVVPGSGQVDPQSTAKVTIPDQVYPDTNPQTDEPAGACIPLCPTLICDGGLR